MIIYNVTTKVATAIAADWLEWMKTEHIPAIMATGLFSAYRIVRLLEVDDSEGPTYAVQYDATDKTAYDVYISRHADCLRAAAYEKWGNAFIAFRSVMEVV